MNLCRLCFSLFLTAIVWIVSIRFGWFQCFWVRFACTGWASLPWPTATEGAIFSGSYSSMNLGLVRFGFDGCSTGRNTPHQPPLPSSPSGRDGAIGWHALLFSSTIQLSRLIQRFRWTCDHRIDRRMGEWMIHRPLLTFPVHNAPFDRRLDAANQYIISHFYFFRSFPSHLMPSMHAQLRNPHQSRVSEGWCSLFICNRNFTYFYRCNTGIGLDNRRG